MTEIKLIPRGKVHIQNVGLLKGLLPLILLLSFSAIGFAAGVIGLGLFFLAPIMPLLIFLLFPNGHYIPEISFKFYRLTKDRINKILYSFSAIYFTLVIVSVFSLVDDFTLSKSLKFIGGVAGVYGLIFVNLKKLKFHEDVDYSANQELMDMLKTDVNEKIIGSYMNCSPTGKIKQNSNIVIFTSRKIFFAFRNQNKWYTLNKLYSEIDKIGIHGALVLIFKDNTQLTLRYNTLEDNNISHPNLLIRQFLTALDLFCLGKTTVSNEARRRVVIQTESIQENFSLEKSSRAIELNIDVINELKAAAEIKSGRILEI